jgi:hypothetical protein
MNLYSTILQLAAIASLAALSPAMPPRADYMRDVKLSAPLPQEATARLKIIPTTASMSWPNNGVMPVLTYGWGGDRPLPPIMALDSSIVPQLAAPRPPILIVQRRKDNFSPLLQEMFDQNVTMRAMTITIEPIARETMAYTMWNVRVLGIRDVGQVIQENPVTEEIVFIFDRLGIGDVDEAGR